MLKETQHNKVCAILVVFPENWRDGVSRNTRADLLAALKFSLKELPDGYAGSSQTFIIEEMQPHAE